MEDSAFSSCKDLVTVKIDCDSVALGEYAFYNSEDLIRVSICEYSKSDNNIEIDDRAFRYCKRLCRLSKIVKDMEFRACFGHILCISLKILHEIIIFYMPYL